VVEQSLEIVKLNLQWNADCAKVDPSTNMLRSYGMRVADYVQP
jgi:hypothetical protein